MELNSIVLKAKQDTGAQINVLSKTVFQTAGLQVTIVPQRLVSSWWGMEIKSTKIKCNHNGTKTEAIFYITDVPNAKIILGL